MEIKIFRRTVITSLLLMAGVFLIFHDANATNLEGNSITNMDVFSDEQQIRLSKGQDNLTEDDLLNAKKQSNLPANMEKADYNTYLLLMADLTKKQFNEFKNKGYFHEKATFSDYKEIADSLLLKEEYLKGTEKSELSSSQLNIMYPTYVASLVKYISPS